MTLPAFFLSVIVLGGGLAACSGERAGSEPVDSFALAVEARAGVPFAQEGVVVAVEVPTSVAVGNPVPIKVRLSNTTSSPQDLYLRGREITFDIAVTDSAGDAVWRRLEGEVIQAIIQLRTLAPNETIELTHTWDQRSQRGERVPPGRYTLRANILTDGQTALASNEATLVIGDI